MKLYPEERETIILFDESSDKARVFTYNRRLKNRLVKLHASFPDLIHPYRTEEHGAVHYLVPKKCVQILSPYTDDRRRSERERALNSGRKPPSRAKK